MLAFKIAERVPKISATDTRSANRSARSEHFILLFPRVQAHSEASKLGDIAAFAPYGFDMLFGGSNNAIIPKLGQYSRSARDSRYVQAESRRIRPANSGGLVPSYGPTQLADVASQGLSNGAPPVSPTTLGAQTIHRSSRLIEEISPQRIIGQAGTTGRK
jgi:hypothetical protein